MGGGGQKYFGSSTTMGHPRSLGHPLQALESSLCYMGTRNYSILSHTDLSLHGNNKRDKKNYIFKKIANRTHKR